MLYNSYSNQGDTLAVADEDVVDCGTMDFKKSSSDRWNPNVPFIGTQEEWWEHFHQIERGNFMTIEEADKKFEIWKEKFLASRMSLA
ncbi:MAG: hypothetical protein FWH36_07110 [Lentimicrobiaceae bacterium]|nr:hypothetical protein [Lentimicrobiaceae bacterium]